MFGSDRLEGQERNCVHSSLKRGKWVVEDLIQLDSYPVQETLQLLLQDKTTKKHIIWATDSYASFGESYTDRSQIRESQLANASHGMIQPRISKDMKQQTLRTRKSAEVFTPA